MTAIVDRLLPGDRVTLGGRSAVYVQRARHPLWSHLWLVLWKLDDGTWSHDALLAGQEVGELVPATYETRMARLRQVFLNHG